MTQTKKFHKPLKTFISRGTFKLSSNNLKFINMIIKNIEFRTSTLLPMN